MCNNIISSIFLHISAKNISDTLHVEPLQLQLTCFALMIMSPPIHKCSHAHMYLLSYVRLLLVKLNFVIHITK